MDLFLFLKGIFVGFLIAAPVGPVGILCAQRTLQLSLPAGLTAGLGAAVADAIFGAVAAFGLTFVAHILLENETLFRLIGGLLLLVLGVRTFRKPPPDLDQRISVTANHIAGGFISTFALTITNPITIMSFGPVFVAANAVVEPGSLAAAWTLIVGVFAGSGLWWLLLCTGISLFKRKVTESHMRWINKLSGAIIVFFGILVIASVTEFGAGLLNIPSL
ncbi:MAG TPA: LysE family transporter [Alphaproteobacteria bacterium]|jgi:threonine/homoserine/homoserine lactone efflux protein|nr:LysE family transporter [Alphaproteobacteria bacterium]